MKKLIIIVVLAFALFIGKLSNLYSQIRINEILASNFRLYYDEDYESSDWIELYNSGDQAVNLKGWRIADRNDFSNAWVFPDTILEAKSYLVIFASGKNRITSGNLIIEGAGFGYATWTSWEGFRYSYLNAEGNFDFRCKIQSIRNTKLFGSAGIDSEKI